MPNIDIFSFLQTIYVLVKNRGQMTRFVFAPIPMLFVEKTLQQYGVIVWGRSLRSNGERTFLVRNAQAKWAHQLCLRAGFPIIAPSFPENEKYRNAGLPKKQWQKDGRKGDVFYAFSNFLKVLKWFG